MAIEQNIIFAGKVPCSIVCPKHIAFLLFPSSRDSAIGGVTEK